MYTVVGRMRLFAEEMLKKGQMVEAKIRRQIAVNLQIFLILFMSCFCIKLSLSVFMFDQNY